MNNIQKTKKFISGPNDPDYYKNILKGNVHPDFNKTNKYIDEMIDHNAVIEKYNMEKKVKNDVLNYFTNNY